MNERISSNTFAVRLRHLRTQAGLTVADLAARAGISRQYICDLEAGRRVDPRLSLLVKISDALGVSLDAMRG